MYCNRCGNQVDPNSQFCSTCGNSITPTVVPQSDNTVVPTNGTVVPTVVPQNNKSNVTITSIIIVLTIFIGAGILGILLLKNSKSNLTANNSTTQIAMDNITSAITKETSTKKTGWVTTSQRVDVIDPSTSYSVNGVNINIPEGYNPSYTNDVLTVIANNGSNYYMVHVIDGIFENVNLNTFKSNLEKNGYVINEFSPGTYMDRQGIKIDLMYSGYNYICYVLKANDSKIALFLFDKSATYEYANEMVTYSLK